MKKSVILAAFIVCLVPASLALAADGIATTQKTEVTIQQTYLKETVGKFLQDMEKIAAALEPKEPDSAHAIREAIKAANDAAITDDIDSVVKALMDDKLAKALGHQEGITKSLKDVLEVLRRGGQKSDADRRAAELAKQLEDVNKILDDQKKLEQNTRMTAAKDLAKQMQDLMAQIGDIAKEQKQLMSDSDKANPDDQVKKLADMLNEIRRLIADQEAVKAATATATIDRLPLVAQAQKALGERADKVGKQLADAAKDDKVAKMIKDTGGDPAAPTEAAKNVALANGEMQKATDALSKSTPKEASVSQEQAREDLKNAEKLLAAAVAKAATATEAGKLAAKQSDLENKTLAVAAKADDLTKKIGLEDENKPGEAKPGEAKPGESKPGESKPGESKPGESKPGESKPGESKPGESKPGESKPGESKPGESKPESKQNNLQKAAEHMNNASKQLNGQQPKPATAEQQKAIDQLEEKKLQLADLKGKVLKLAEKPLPEQAKQQKDLADKSDDLAKKMAKQGDQQPGQKPTKSASKSQSDASKKLGDQDPEEANKKQKDAIKDLELAKAELEDALDEAKKQAEAEKLAKIDSLLGAILSRQQDDSKVTKETFLKSGGKDVYERAGELKLAEVAKDEAVLKDQTGEVLALIAKDGDSTVFTPILKQVQDDLGGVQRFLGQKSAGLLTQKMQSDIEHRLQDMIDAVNKQRADVIHRPKKAGGGGGGGSGGGGKKPPLVPPLAELKLLLKMQNDVNETTLLLDQNTAKLPATTLDGSKKMLSDEQGKVGDMMKKAANKLKPDGAGGPPPSSF